MAHPRCQLNPNLCLCHFPKGRFHQSPLGQNFRPGQQQSFMKPSLVMQTIISTNSKKKSFLTTSRRMATSLPSRATGRCKPQARLVIRVGRPLLFCAFLQRVQRTQRTISFKAFSMALIFPLSLWQWNK